jgi:hypothetical protein
MQGGTSTGKSPAYSPTTHLRSAAGAAASPMAQQQSPAYSPSSLRKSNPKLSKLIFLFLL